MGLKPALVAVAVMLAAPACSSSDVAVAPGCLDETLSSYREVVSDAAAGRGSDFRASAREAADVTAACAKEAVDECRDALGDLASALRDAATDVARSPSSFREHRTKLEGAAAAATACAREVL